MSLIQTINRAGKRLFIHFHDDAEFKETEHPRGKGGLFVKKGTGGGAVAGPPTGSEKPKAAPGAVVVNPVAKVLKEHGYEKQKGSNVYKHHTGHEVEVHAAAEGQKWLTGWTHGTTGNTGSGAGKLGKHLASLPHGTMSSPQKKEEPDPFEKKIAELSSYKPKPPPKTLADYPPMAFVKPTAKPHPLPKVHNALSNQGFVPTSADLYETTYQHNNKGKVVITNTPPKSGVNKGKVKWSYYTNPYDTKPTTTGNGIFNGKLDEALNKHAPPTPPPSTPATTKSDVVKPSWAKYANSEGSSWQGLSEAFGAKNESAIRYYNGDPDYATESLIIGTGENNKGQWQLWTKEGGVVATGEGQDELNAAFENLHPRGEGGKFVAKPGSKEEKLAKQVETYANPLMEQGFKPYGEDDDTVWFEKGNTSISVGKKLNYPSGNQSWHIGTGADLLSGEGKGGLLDALKELEGGAVARPSGVDLSDHNKLVSAGYKPAGTAPWGENIEIYAKEDGTFLLTKPLPNGMHSSIFAPHETALENYGDLLTQMLDGNTPKIGVVPEDGTIISPSPQVSEFNKAETSNAISGLFSPFKAKGFDLNPDLDTGGIVGILQNDPVLNMAFSYNPQTKKGLVSYQVKGDTGNSKSQVFNGTPGEFYNKVVEQHDEGMSAAGPAPIKAEHFVKGSPIPAELNGIPFAPYVPPYDWHSVEGQNEHIQEPPMPVHPGKKPSAGLLIEEPDGRIWIVKPKNEYQGVKYTFPKGGQEAGDSLQATAIKEGWEESGLKAEITGYAGDYLGTTSITRYYYAKRTGGTPIGYGDDESELVSLIPKEELHQYLNQARDLQIAKDHFSPKAIGRSSHFNSMTKVGEKKGSNPGGIYQSPSGKKYYVKMPQSNQHTANELLAADLMAKAGGGTLKYHQITADGGKNYVGTEWEELQKDNVSKLSLNERKMAQSDFAINAWLANWDAAGTGGDNTGVLNGKTVTLDVGGALLYRAQGTPKGDLFGYVPDEWSTMRSDKIKNPDAVKLYGDMTPQQLKESAEKLNKITNKDIQDAVHAHFDVQDIVGDDLIDKLIARRDKIIQWGALIPAATPTYTPPSSAQATAAQAKYQPIPTPTKTYTQQDPGPKGHSDPDGLRRKVASWNPPSKPSSAITGYKGNSYYKKMNFLMRHGDLEDDDQSTEANYIRGITKWLDKASTKEELVVYRGVKNDVATQWNEFAKPGRVIRDSGFQSTATSKDFADGWAGHSGLTLKIHMPAGTKAATIKNENESDGEFEVLLQKGTVMRIIKWEPGNHEVAIEQPGLPKWKPQGTT